MLFYAGASFFESENAFHSGYQDADESDSNRGQRKRAARSRPAWKSGSLFFLGRTLLRAIAGLDGSTDGRQHLFGCFSVGAVRRQLKVLVERFFRAGRRNDLVSLGRRLGDQRDALSEIRIRS